MEIPEELIAALEGPALELTGLPGVNGVGLGMREEDEEFFDELTVRVYVDDAADVPELPTQMADLPVQVIEFPVMPLFTPDHHPPRQTRRRHTDCTGPTQQRHPRHDRAAQRRQHAGRPTLPSRLRGRRIEGLPADRTADADRRGTRPVR
ncbi:hypothetical protein [Allorhizocola rhizosphaerae]|uniref:hypothetical protein n=1 Tax=Allorhizocola rhizosphaerae TaxID=1872709 RepID=UPI000E3CC700|nr:hypothetical protein [Allorhizocola rhizosphaerae]